MAAGLRNVSRRRYSHHYEEESRVFSTDVYHKKDLSQNHNCWGSELRLSTKSLSSSVNYGGRSFSQGERKGSVAGTLNREHGGVYGGGSRSSNCAKEIPMSEDGASMPPEKKRKFSPVVWDRDEMQVRISSKNRIVPASSMFSPPLARKIVVGVLDFQSFVGTERHSFAAREIEDVQITPVELPAGTSTYGVGMSLFPVDQTDTSPKKFCADNQKPERNIYKSKWAYVESPSASLESGELSQESSEESRDDSLGSAGEVPVIRPASGDEQSKNEFHIRDDMEVDDPIDDISPVHSCSKDEEDLGMIQGEEVMKRRRFDMLQGCRSVYKYERLNKISEGTYGVVFRGKDKETGEIVALKKVKMGNARCGFPVSALREINILMSLHHPSIVEVKEVVMDDRDGVFMVMQYLDHELKGLMDTMKQPFSQSEVKCLMIQLLEGLSYLHDNWVLHRDLKTSNLLLSSKGELKICDFGLSRRYGRPIKPYTPLVVTLWYRAPELLLGVKEYSTAVDMWSVGCIMAELLAKKPLFNGQKELEQLNKIFNTLGTPDVTIWPGYMSLPGIRGNFVKQPYNRLRKIFPAATFTGSPVLTELGFDLLSKLLTYDPERRITAADALNHGWFREFPLPSEHVKIRK